MKFGLRLPRLELQVHARGLDFRPLIMLQVPVVALASVTAKTIG